MAVALCYDDSAGVGLQELGGMAGSMDGGESASAAMASGEDADTEVAVALSAPAHEQLSGAATTSSGVDPSFGAVTI